MKISTFLNLLTIGYALSLQASPPPPPHGNWGDFVQIYTTSTPPATINADTSAAFTENGTAVGNSSLPGFAFLFAPGPYSDTIKINVGSFTSIIGLGTSPTDTILNNVTAPLNNEDHCTGALRNVWRSAENFQTTPAQAAPNQMGLTGMTWACSNGSPLRRLIVNGNLFLSEKTNEPGNPYAASTGAFMADSEVNGTIYAGAQQQSLMRNTSMSGWTGGKWNQVFVGCTGGVPSSSCGNCVAANLENGNLSPDCPSCTTNTQCTTDVLDLPDCKTAVAIMTPTPRIAEKPFISSDASATVFTLNIPKNQSPRTGPSDYTDSTSYTSIPFDRVFVADSPEAILENINNLDYDAMIITPGNHLLNEPIVIKRSDFTLLGIGFPVLINKSFFPGVIQVGNGKGIRIGGIILDGEESQFTAETSSLLEWGTDSIEISETQGKECYLYDCYAKIANSRQDPVTEAMIKINSPHVVCDNIWLVRGDFSPSSLGGPSCPTGARINGEDVIVYGMACDKFFQNLLEWYGNNGQCYSFQGTFPPRGDSPYAFTGYLVNSVNLDNLNSVKIHTAYGVSLYCSFVDELFAMEGISTPAEEGITFVNALTRFLGGQGAIKSVMNVSPGFNTNESSEVNSDFPGPCSVCQYKGTIPANPAPFASAGK